MFSLGESFDGSIDECCMRLRSDGFSDGRSRDFVLLPKGIDYKLSLFGRQLFNAVDDLIPFRLLAFWAWLSP